MTTAILGESPVSGKPFNIAGYAFLTHLAGRECGLSVGEFVPAFGDVHLQANHEAQAREPLSRQPRPRNPWPAIKAPVAA